MAISHSSTAKFQVIFAFLIVFSGRLHQVASGESEEWMEACRALHTSGIPRTKARGYLDLEDVTNATDVGSSTPSSLNATEAPAPIGSGLLAVGQLANKQLLLLGRGPNFTVWLASAQMLASAQGQIYLTGNVTPESLEVKWPALAKDQKFSYVSTHLSSVFTWVDGNKKFNTLYLLPIHESKTPSLAYDITAGQAQTGLHFVNTETAPILLSSYLKDKFYGMRHKSVLQVATFKPREFWPDDSPAKLARYGAYYAICINSTQSIFLSKVKADETPCQIVGGPNWHIYGGMVAKDSFYLLTPNSTVISFSEDVWHYRDDMRHAVVWKETPLSEFIQCGNDNLTEPLPDDVVESLPISTATWLIPTLLVVMLLSCCALCAARITYVRARRREQRVKQRELAASLTSEEQRDRYYRARERSTPNALTVAQMKQLLKNKQAAQLVQGGKEAQGGQARGIVSPTHPLLQGVPSKTDPLARGSGPLGGKGSGDSFSSNLSTEISSMQSAGGGKGAKQQQQTRSGKRALVTPAATTGGSLKAQLKTKSLSKSEKSRMSRAVKSKLMVKSNKTGGSRSKHDASKAPESSHAQQ